MIYRPTTHSAIASLKGIAYGCSSLINIPKLIHKLYYRNNMVIVCYHGIIKTPLPVYDHCFLEESTFHRQIRYLKKNFSIRKLSDIGNASGYKSDKPVLAITFDDGFQNNYTSAYPILLEENIPATVFLSTRFIDTAEILWFCKLNYAFTVTKKPKFYWDGYEFDIKDRRKRPLVSEYLQKRLKRLTDDELKEEVDHIIAYLGLDPSIRVREDSPYRMLTREAIQKMAGSGIIEFGSHTRNHAILNKLSIDKQRDEITTSMDDITRITDRHCTLFAYPNGDFNADTLAVLTDCGIKIAVTTMDAPNTSATNSLLLNRVGIEGDIRFGHFQARIHLMTRFLKHMGAF